MKQQSEKMEKNVFPHITPYFFKICMIAAIALFTQSENLLAEKNRDTGNSASDDQLQILFENPDGFTEDTMLMFVGENLEVLSIASRREESAWRAPAVAEVITRKEFTERGARTLSQALEMTPGFYTAHKEWGTQPYLRGIPDSVLFLYDTVSICSDLTKSLHPLDYELSLSPIKRIEIIRGPGSFLWGPDAFAGIVNIVPMTGKDIDGVETGVSYGAPGDNASAFLNMGYHAMNWDAFFSFSGRTENEDDTQYNLVRYWENGDLPVSPDERYGSGTLGGSRYIEGSFHVNYDEWLILTGRWSDNYKTYAMKHDRDDIIWQENRRVPMKLIKAELKKTLGISTAFRLTGSFTTIHPEYEVIDLSYNHQEDTYFLEGIYDQSFFSGTGLFTGGISFREKNIRNAPVWSNYLPLYLVPENKYFLPRISQTDYNTELISTFGQYNHKIGDLDVWFGARYEEHDKYTDHQGYNAGAVWSPHSDWVLKFIYGTAYRTPFARQLLEDDKPELEKIKTYNFQAAWEPSKALGANLCLFYNKISNHIMEDPYAGLSMPNDQEISGAELEGHYAPFHFLDISANLTLLDNSGPDETYKYVDYTYVRPDGSVEPHYVDIGYPYDSGPDSLFNLMITVEPWNDVTSFFRLSYTGSRNLIYPRSEEYVLNMGSPGIWLADTSLSIRDFVIPGIDLEISAKNLTDRRYKTPGTYNVKEGESFSVEALIKKRW